MTANNALERPCGHRGPRPPAAQVAWPVAQLGRQASRKVAAQNRRCHEL